MSEDLVIPDASVERLKKDPSIADVFDKVYGPGAASSVLGTARVDPNRKTKEEDGPEHQKDLTIAGKLWDSTLGAVAWGGQEAANEIVDSFESLDEWFGSTMEKVGVPAYIFITDDEGNPTLDFKYHSEVVKEGHDLVGVGKLGVEDDGWELNIKDRPQTMTGQFVGGLSQFVLPYAGLSKAAKTTSVLGTFVKGGIVDVTAFDPDDPNVAALVESYGVDMGKFGDLMATDPDDPEWENRLRNLMEGAAAGGVVEMIAYGFRARKFAKEGKPEKAEEASRAATRALKEVEKELADAAKSLKDDADDTIELSKTIFDDVELAKGDDGKIVARELTDDVDEVEFESTGREVDPDDAVTPARDPDQTSMDLGEPKTPKPDLKEGRARWLTREEAESIRYYSTLGKHALPRELIEGQAIKGAGQVKQYEDVLPQLAAFRKVFKNDWDKIPGSGVERWSTTSLKAAKALKELSALTGEDPNEVVKRFAGGFEKKEDLAAEIVARSAYVTSLLRETEAMAKAIAEDTFDPKRWKGYRDMEHLRLDYNAKISLAKAVAQENKAARSSVGRALNAMKIDKSKDAVLKRVMADPYLQDNIKSMATAHREATKSGTPVIKAMDEAMTVVKKTLDAINTYRINALLSGPGTQEVNFISNLINTIAIPTQQVIGGMTTFNGKMMMHGVRTIQGMIASAFDSTDAALKSLYNDQGILDPMGGKLEEDMIGAGSGNIFGKTMRLPSRMLLGMDEFFKQSAYRGRVFADASYLAKQKGLKGKDKTDFIKGYIKNSFDEAGNGTRGEAMLQAQRSTFTEHLDQGTFPAKIQKLAVDHPTVRFIVPFVRTPVNILVNAVQHMPVVGALSKRWRADVAAGGPRKAQAIGKMGIGTALVTMAATHASLGNITGSGPADPRLRRVWLKNNNPYSVRIVQEDGSVRWVSYQRYEPMAQLLALVADYTEIMRNEYNENDSRSVPMAILMATAENSVNKTFTQGIHEFMAILNDPSPHSRERALNNMLGSFVPNFINQTNGDEAYREARTLVDTMWSRTGNFKKVDPKRNVLGEAVMRPLPKVDPLAAIYKDVREHDPVMDEITRVAILNQTVAGNPDRKIPAPQEPSGHIDLSEITYEGNQSLYDKWLEHTGEIEIGGRTLREELERTINSSSYKRLPDGAKGVSRGTKSAVIKKIISEYRSAAKRDIPELVEVIKASRRGEKNLLRKQMRENRSGGQLFKDFKLQERQLLQPPKLSNKLEKYNFK